MNEGRADADLEFGDMSSSNGAKFKETILPPGYLDKPRDEVLAVTAATPEVKPGEVSPRNSARPNEAASGSEAWNRNIRPRHRNAVKQYFSERDQK